MCPLGFNDNPVVFPDSSDHDYHFIIKELANNFDGKFESLKGNTEVQNIFRFNRKRNQKS